MASTKTQSNEEDGEIETVPMTEQVMDPNIKITDVPDVEYGTEEWDANWDKNKVIRDVAYYIRAHKFQDFDRRYYRSLEDSPSRLYEEFPKPPLRSLHWEVRRHCDASFLECLKYLERTIKLTALRREDDTVTIMKEQKWNLANNTKQLLSVQKACQMAQRRDNLTMVPFQGPIERFQWRTTVSYYMCWYTMLGVPELSIFGESCGNHANCQIEYGADNGDPRADDTKPYGCALYSFCPDHCCPMRHIRYTIDCEQSPLNPCYSGNTAMRRECSLNRQENHDFVSLITNQINISCQCLEHGYEWSSRFGICIDVNECTRGEHDCSSEDGETCINMPGGYECVCRFGYVYDPEQRSCVLSSAVEDMLTASEIDANVTKTKSVFETIVDTITKSTGNRLINDCRIVFLVISTRFWILAAVR
ncbi:mesocentin-like [Hylaeus volcanicus]|uniref:mesocentin-like n=1 Tax=Hylaeus volcanicus TaxID=313075 RepID=UPI0023B77E55|nr:mesocentin-like [Hylaeus volcanicus]